MQTFRKIQTFGKQASKLNTAAPNFNTELSYILGICKFTFFPLVFIDIRTENKKGLCKSHKFQQKTAEAGDSKFIGQNDSA